MARARSVTSARAHTGDRQTDDAWSAIRTIEEKLLANPFTGGRLITYEEDDPAALPDSGLLFVSGTARNIPHKLGRKARGFLELYGVGVTTAAVVGLRPSAPTSGVTADTHVSVTPASNGRAWLLVF